MFLKGWSYNKVHYLWRLLVHLFVYYRKHLHCSNSNLLATCLKTMYILLSVHLGYKHLKKKNVFFFRIDLVYCHILYNKCHFWHYSEWKQNKRWTIASRNQNIWLIKTSDQFHTLMNYEALNTLVDIYYVLLSFNARIHFKQSLDNIFFVRIFK